MEGKSLLVCPVEIAHIKRHFVALLVSEQFGYPGTCVERGTVHNVGLCMAGRVWNSKILFLFTACRHVSLDEGASLRNKIEEAIGTDTWVTRPEHLVQLAKLRGLSSC